MNKVDRKKLLNNIKYYGKLKGLKIGEIEQAVGKRLGIFSRWSNKQIETISLDVVYNVSLLLGVKIDDLINLNLDKELKLQELTELQKEREIVEKKITALEKEIEDEM